MKTIQDYIRDDTFTSRSRKVLELARQEAVRFNHEFIGTEHLLLGLAKEGSGVGASVLKTFNLPFSIARIKVEEVFPQKDESGSIATLPLDSNIVQALEQSRIEAQRLNHSFIGTEHLLLGLLKTPENNNAHLILERQKISSQDVIDDVIWLLGDGSTHNMVAERNKKGILVFGAEQVKELLGGNFPDSGACAGYQAGFLFGQCEYHLVGNQLVPYMGGLPADGPNFQLTMVPRPA